LDETTYARELAPLAGHYPALKLGPPWWFHDSPNGMQRYFDQVMENGRPVQHGRFSTMTTPRLLFHPGPARCLATPLGGLGGRVGGAAYR